jgi:hypothetical protein
MAIKCMVMWRTSTRLLSEWSQVRVLPGSPNTRYYAASVTGVCAVIPQTAVDDSGSIVARRGAIHVLRNALGNTRGALGTSAADAELWESGFAAFPTRRSWPGATPTNTTQFVALCLRFARWPSTPTGRQANVRPPPLFKPEAGFPLRRSWARRRENPTADRAFGGAGLVFRRHATRGGRGRGVCARR